MENFKHHYVPQFYLKGFTDSDGLIHVTDKVLRKRWRTAPRNVAWAPEFYKVDVSGMDPMGIEKAFGQVEGQCASMLREVLTTREIPSGQNAEVLLNFVALSITRVPLIRAKIAEFIDGVAKSLGKLAFLGPEGIRRLKEDPEIARMSEEEMERFQEFMQSAEYTVNVDQNWHVTMLLDSITQILPLLTHRSWSVWTVDDAAPNLVTSDRPVALSGGPAGMAGLGTAETLLTMPLDKRTLLASTLEEILTCHVMDTGEVEAMNMVRSENGSQIYSSEQDWACAFEGSQAYLDALIYPNQPNPGPFPREGQAS